jgi:hypothetical protein
MLLKKYYINIVYFRTLYFERKTNSDLNRYMLKKIRVRVFNATFNNISVVSWQSESVSLVVETGSTRRKPLTCHK